ncbi:aldo/keto reductase [Halanaerobium sp. MA284_MarDTE_T2]|uniref:aldo/keto reductase n=1 Tax=Halanaerobium sp. MA284_MarDTE_T2 TaxID=2183913 RepID=UPI000DF1120B|nr:aldo/keto reductase [Halanaerobium sp. MA284_MarDTE_T2]RCW48629.1 4Fe-4S binding protein [Halanaerobium sp. MA284_MarDTE_T2]
MEKKLLRSTDLEVSKMCFGALPLGPAQKNMPLNDGIEVIKYAFDSGINFIDTAEMYRTYDYIAPVIKNLDREDFVITSKSHAETYEEVVEHVENGLTKLGIEYFDIFHIHAARESEPFSKRKETLRALIDLKVKGKIKNIGIATHYVEVVKRAAENENIDVVFAIYNITGRGIVDGSREDMSLALKYAHDSGKAVYAMKPLAGGNLIDDINEAFEFVLNKEFIDSIAVGMVAKEEVDLNLKIFAGEKITEDMKIEKEKKKLTILNKLCIKCLKCIETCPNYALSIVDDKVTVDHEKCILCGYCSPVCPQFCIRIT